MPAASEKHYHYDIPLKLEPGAKLIQAKVNLTLFVPSDVMLTATLNLHRQLAIHRVAGRNLSDDRFERETVHPPQFVPESGTQNLSPPHSVSLSDRSSFCRIP